MPVDDPQFRDLVCFNFYVGWRHIQAIYRQAFPDGVGPQRAYLLCACNPEEGTPVASLLDALDLDSPAMSGLLGRLQSDGLLVREINPNDRREIYVHLTSAGVQLRQETLECLQAADQLLAQYVSRGELDKLRGIVGRLGDLAEEGHSTAVKGGRQG
jgi:DNA-binding MarR family transcriptional regulator